MCIKKQKKKIFFLVQFLKVTVFMLNNKIRLIIINNNYKHINYITLIINIFFCNKLRQW